MKHYLFNVAHPMAESGMPIFIPFGEWKYDASTRQRLDRAHGVKIANELNARVAKGEPGIPVYQGHPDVPQLAAKYPDKGALGWVTKIELVNESPDGRAVPGLALTVEWDRDPGRGFRWFSPYWMANEREGATYIVDEIASIGLVNKPNIPEFRLANEEATMYKLPPRIVELAARRDAALANEANFDESKHPRASDGKFSSAGGSSGGDSASTAKQGSVRQQSEKFKAPAEMFARFMGEGRTRTDALKGLNGMITQGRRSVKAGGETAAAGIAERRAAHRVAISLGFKYNPTTHQYE